MRGERKGESGGREVTEWNGIGWLTSLSTCVRLAMTRPPSSTVKSSG